MPAQRYRLINETVRANAARFVAALPLPEGKKPPFVLLVQREVKTRSLPQNAKMHVCWAELAKALGWQEDAMKEHFKATHGPRLSLELNGKPVRVPKRSRDYTEQEASDMIEHIQREAAECGVML